MSLFGPDMGQQQQQFGSISPYLQQNNAAALPGMDYGTLGTFGQNSGGVGQGTGFDWGGIGQGVTQGLGGLTSLAQIYGMFQNLGLQKKAFKFAQEGTKRNFNASATGFNNEVNRRGNSEAAYAAQNPGYGSLTEYGKVEKWS